MADISNILIVGSFCKGAIENFFKRGLELRGVKITSYPIADQYTAAIGNSLPKRAINKIIPSLFYKPLNKQLLSFLRSKQFDVILVFKGMELFPETVQQLKSHARLLTNYNCDHPFKFYSAGSGNANVLNSIPHYDVHFSYAKRITEQLKNDFGKEAHCIPFGFDSEAELDQLRGNSLDCNGKFLFIGAYDKERAAYLDELKEERLDIYGNSKWKTRNALRPYILNAYRQREIFGNEYISAINTAAGIINLLRMQNLKESSHNMRTFEVPGYGGLLISQRTDEQPEFFEEDKEAIYFSSMEELREKLAYLKNHADVVEKIKRAAYTRSIQSGYSYNERSSQLLDKMRLHFN